MKPKYRLGDIVYFITDIDQHPFMVTAIVFRINSIHYKMSQGPHNEIEASEMEVSLEKTVF